MKVIKYHLWNSYNSIVSILQHRNQSMWYTELIIKKHDYINIVLNKVQHHFVNLKTFNKLIVKIFLQKSYAMASKCLTVPQNHYFGGK